MGAGINWQMGHTNVGVLIVGVIGFVLLLPTILLGYAVEALGGFGMTVETLLMFVAQAVGYFGMIWIVDVLNSCIRAPNQSNSTDL
jgi:hypothetical protein